MAGIDRLAQRAPVLLAVLSGALTTLAYAPFNLWPFALLGPLGLFLIWQRRGGADFRTGFGYGFGLLGSGVSWLYVSIAQFGDLGWLFPLFLTLSFILLMALYYGALGWWAGRFSRLPESLRFLLVYPTLWVVVEWLRGWFLTGFPWLQLGYSQIDTPLSGYAPVLGVLGASWAVMLSVGLLWAVISLPRKRLLYALSMAVLWLGGGLLGLISWSQPIGEPLRVALIQGNIPQAEKWLPEQLAPSLVRYAKMTRDELDGDLVVWPETAVSAFQHQVEEAFITPLETTVRNRGSHLVFGVVQMDEKRERYYNALVALGNEQRDRYYKGHLVPFTEYLPWATLFRPLVDLFTLPMSDFSARQEEKPLMQVGPYAVGMSICYEDAFGNEMIQALPEATYLINVSNDAWFGDSLAPRQHLQIARMRARETARYLLRATNTGISAIVAPDGHLQETAPLLEQAVVKGSIQPMQGMTPYARFGNLPLLLMLTAVVVASLIRKAHNP
ncbi:MAG: apolipoprotein N-acyltransferase [Candidatus Thiodiazotropha sp.]